MDRCRFATLLLASAGIDARPRALGRRQGSIPAPWVGSQSAGGARGRSQGRSQAATPRRLSGPAGTGGWLKVSVQTAHARRRAVFAATGMLNSRASSTGWPWASSRRTSRGGSAGGAGGSAGGAGSCLFCPFFRGALTTGFTEARSLPRALAARSCARCAQRCYACASVPTHKNTATSLHDNDGSQLAKDAPSGSSRARWRFRGPLLRGTVMHIIPGSAAVSTSTCALTPEFFGERRGE